jgi:hypothetical protein
MPALLVATANDPALVAITNKGYAITHAGLKELDRRGIPHHGAEVVAEGGQRLDFGSWSPDDFGDVGGVVMAEIVPEAARRKKKPLQLPAPEPTGIPNIVVPKTFAEYCQAIVDLIQRENENGP